jgi:hypothetical protein
MDMNTRLELLASIGQQILAMANAGAVDVRRAAFCTAGKFADSDLRAALAMLHAGGMLNYRAGKYHAVTSPAVRTNVEVK